MTTTTRHFAFAATALGLLTGLLVADHATNRRRTAPQASVVGARPVLTAREGLDRVPAPGVAVGVEATTREFLRAYLPYTHGKSTPLKELRGGVASPALVTRLLTDNPHSRRLDSVRDVVRGVRVERLTDRAAISLARITGPGGGYAIALTVHRDTHGRWQVVDTRPAG